MPRHDDYNDALQYISGLMNMSTAIIFPPRGMKLKQGLEEPQIVEKVAFVEEINCIPGAFIYYKNKWYVKQRPVKRIFASLIHVVPKEVHEDLVPPKYRAWALILV